MSTRSHFIYGNEIQGFTECSEPREVFGKFVGYDAYLIIGKEILKSISIVDQFLIVKMKHDYKEVPAEFKIWGDAIVEFKYCFLDDELLIQLEGGHHITKQIVSNDYSKLKL
ncbi:MAG: hypothetical protein JWP12_310 [Bacteroidetes bacterium]|nr:hypothetical protein [Bacteroidota bacterium]